MKLNQSHFTSFCSLHRPSRQWCGARGSGGAETFLYDGGEGLLREIKSECEGGKKVTRYSFSSDDRGDGKGRTVVSEASLGLSDGLNC